MLSSTEFFKLSASGNDFICIDNLDGRFDGLINDPDRIAHVVCVLCERGPGIGADGVLFACQPEIDDVADIAARIFEADGSEVELCGNGTACFLHWIISHGLIEPGEVRILTQAGVVRGRNGEGKYIRVCIPLPEDITTDFDIVAAGETFRCDFAVTGVPHVITYVDDVWAVDVDRLGRAMRHHERFAPRGVNANFVQIIDDGEIAVRTFEFGVEAETLACGTGSAAAAVLAAKRFGWGTAFTTGDQPVRIHTRGGKDLQVYFSLDENGQVDDLCLETIVELIYRATMGPDLVAAICQASCT